MLQKIWAQFKKFSYFLALSSLGLLFFAGQAGAATLYLTTSTNSVKVGELVTIRALVNTQNKTINNAEAAIIFNKDLVEVISLTTRNTIFTLWVEQPNFSNSSGRITFNGGLPNPGYTGGGGEIVSVTFRAKAQGTAAFSFAGAAVRENDGLGTDIFSGQGTVSVAIASDQPAEEPEETPQPEEEPEEEVVVSGAPVISSPTYPDPNAWYSARAGLVTWRLGSGATSVQTLLGSFPNSTPSITYTPPIYQRQISNLDDGIWYFHLRYQRAGQWSATAHYRIQIDGTAPTDLNIEPIQDANGLSLKLSAEDNLSGVDYYLIKLDGQEPLRVEKDQAANPIPLSKLRLGENNITVEVYDLAGNVALDSLNINVSPLVSPVIDDYSEQLTAGEQLTLSGHAAYIQAKVKIALKFETGEMMTYDALTDNNGNFTLATPVNIAGNYQLWAYVVDDNNVKSPDSGQVNLVVETVVPVKSSKKIAISWPVILITLAAMIFIAVISYALHLIFVLRRKLKELEKKSIQTLSALITRATKQIVALNKSKERRKLTSAEAKALADLTETIKEINKLKNNKL